MTDLVFFVFFQSTSTPSLPCGCRWYAVAQKVDFSRDTISNFAETCKQHENSGSWKYHF